MSKPIKFIAEDEVMEIIDRLPHGMRSPFICDCIKFAMESESKTMQWYKERCRKLPKVTNTHKLVSNKSRKPTTVKPKEIPVKQNLPPKVAKDNNVAQNNIVHTDAEFS